MVEQHNEAQVNINPSVDLTHGSYGRPYEKMNQSEIQNHYNTQYKTSHQWPVPENLSRFEWLH